MRKWAFQLRSSNPRALFPICEERREGEKASSTSPSLSLPSLLCPPCCKERSRKYNGGQTKHTLLSPNTTYSPLLLKYAFSNPLQLGDCVVCVVPQRTEKGMERNRKLQPPALVMPIDIWCVARCVPLGLAAAGGGCVYSYIWHNVALDNETMKQGLFSLKMLLFAYVLH